MKQGILTLVTAAALVVVVGFGSTEAKAGSPFWADGLGGCGYGWGGANTGLYGTGQLFPPPYFAVHPPVYYSQPVPRPYGYSPYALPPGMQPAEMLAMPQPEEIINPYVEEEVEAQPTAADAKVATSPKPQWILNPFVEQTVELATLPVVE